MVATYARPLYRLSAAVSSSHTRAQRCGERRARVWSHIDPCQALWRRAYTTDCLRETGSDESVFAVVAETDCMRSSKSWERSRTEPRASHCLPRCGKADLAACNVRSGFLSRCLWSAADVPHE